MEKTKPRRGEIKSRILKMEVGETIFFPFDQFNEASIRSTASTASRQKDAVDKKWITKSDPFGKRVAVTRVM